MKTFLLLLLLLVAGGAYFVSSTDNINADRERAYINIPTGASYTTVLTLLRETRMLNSVMTFDWIAKLKGYPKKITPGHYVFTKTMTNREAVNMLYYGFQSPVKMITYNIRTKEHFARLVGKSLELDSSTILSRLNDEDFCAKYHFTAEDILTHILYEEYVFEQWNISEQNFFKQLDSTYNDFWNANRMQLADGLNLSPKEVIILASIVEKETMKENELPTVAGVYLNRLKIGMPLQADPTLVFALKDFDAKRITNYHKEFDSPYNTYKHEGLPPGPICIPRKKSIDAVLNAEQHGYIYFCANPDMSGFSIFSRTLDEQNKVAKQYRKKLNELNIHNKAK